MDLPLTPEVKLPNASPWILLQNSTDVTPEVSKVPDPKPKSLTAVDAEN